MVVTGKSGFAVLGAVLLLLGACATPQKTDEMQSGGGAASGTPAPATQADIAALRAEIASLRNELRNVTQRADSAAVRAEAAARMAENAASRAETSASKSNKIYTQTLQK